VTRKVDKLEKEIMSYKDNLIKAKKIHDTFMDALVEIVGEDHDAAKRLIKSSRNFWESIDKEGTL